MTQILSVRSAFPANRYPQDELTQKMAELGKLSPSQRGVLQRFHRNAGVDTRYTALPLAEYGTLGGLESSNDRYIEEATSLGERALRDALAAAGLTAQDVDLVIVTSVTGVAVPSLDARLIPRLGLRPDVKRLPVFGLGCVAGAAALARLHDYLLGWPGHVAALLSVELCSLAVPRTGLTTADLVVSGLFGDGAVAVIATGSESAPGSPRPGAIPAPRPVPHLDALPDSGSGPRPGPFPEFHSRLQPDLLSQPDSPAQPHSHLLPRILATRSEVYPDSEDALGWQLRSDGFRIVLTTELGVVVERQLNESVTKFLAGHGLTIDDIGAWVCHPGGPKVIDAVRDSLKLSESAVTASRKSLAEVGNLSSASVLHVLQCVCEAGVGPESFGLMVGLGPGVSAELLLLRW
jgi:alkylresorcinol/alkylpyrone synthase